MVTSSSRRLGKRPKIGACTRCVREINVKTSGRIWKRWLSNGSKERGRRTSEEKKKEKMLSRTKAVLLQGNSWQASKHP